LWHFIYGRAVYRRISFLGLDLDFYRFLVELRSCFVIDTFISYMWSWLCRRSMDASRAVLVVSLDWTVHQSGTFMFCVYQSEPHDWFIWMMRDQPPPNPALEPIPMDRDGSVLER
jgi:hypothetical protein